jgi:hypothetical protein
MEELITSLMGPTVEKSMMPGNGLALNDFGSSLWFLFGERRLPDTLYGCILLDLG